VPLTADCGCCVVAEVLVLETEEVKNLYIFVTQHLPLSNDMVYECSNVFVDD